MDWTQIEKDSEIIDDCFKNKTLKEVAFRWIKKRIESELPHQPPEKLNEEERNEFHNRTDLTVDNIKVTYGK